MVLPVPDLFLLVILRDVYLIWTADMINSSGEDLPLNLTSSKWLTISLNAGFALPICRIKKIVDKTKWTSFGIIKVKDYKGYIFWVVTKKIIKQ